MGMSPTHHDSSDANKLAPPDTPLTKTLSAGNLLSHASGATATGDGSRKQRMSIDAGSLDRMARSPIVPEHEHGLGTSGLRRIRQQPLPRAQTNAASGSTANSRSASFNISLPPSRRPSATLTSGPASPAAALNFSEDLSRFPSESLHSFSFAHQSEEFIYNRQNVLKRSLDFMRDKLGWAATNPAIVQAQAKLTGDTEVQSMMELLQRANLIGSDASNPHALSSLGPITGPAMAGGGENVFEQSFFRSESPTELETQSPSEETSRSTSGGSLAVEQLQRQTTSAIVDEDELSPTADPRASIEIASPEPRRLSARGPRAALKRTYTDIGPLTIQTKLNEVLAQPYLVGDDPKADQLIHPSAFPTTPQVLSAMPGPMSANPNPHGHGNRWAPAAQAIFTTDAHSPWTITSANDLACLVFGVTRAEVRKLGILEVVKEERRAWLEERLKNPDAGSNKPKDLPIQPSHAPTAVSMAMGNGVTARLLKKPPSRVTKARAQTDDGVGSSYAKPNAKHAANKSRGVILCGDVVPIQKRNGAIGSASLWVKEKRGGLIWVLEEIAEDVVELTVDEIGSVVKSVGANEAIFGSDRLRRGMDVQRLIPGLPKLRGTNTGALDYDQINELRHFTAHTSNSINIPVSVEPMRQESTFRVSSFPHIAGIIVLSAATLNVNNSNTVFSSSLFGQAKPQGLHVNQLIPSFDRILRVMTDEDNIELVDGIVIPEHSFRRARALLAMREGKTDAAASLFLRPSGLPAKHRDGSEIMVDVQMRVVKSEKSQSDADVIEEKNESDERSEAAAARAADIVYALWVTYSRHMHATNHGTGPVTQTLSRPGTPPHQPSPGQAVTEPPVHDADDSDHSHTKTTSAPPVSMLSLQLKEAQKDSVPNMPDIARLGAPDAPARPAAKKSISDFAIIEEMGQGAYGQVKLCRYKNSSKKVVIKYVTKRRILVDTWTRDRRLGTVPLEIHVLDYLRRDGLKHANIVEMADFFEDDINYYIEMVPHGLPGMDLFDYIELRVNMEELECRNIFIQVAEAVHHLHTKAKVVHRDIKDENVILDGEGNIKLIDFGSAAYIKNGPFDVFVGTIDYAAPEVLAGKSYRGKEQDVWALGILLYTIVYKENPFYSIDEIMDHDLRVPYIMSEDSIDLIRLMLNRDVEKRITIGQVLEHAWCRLPLGG